MDRNNKYWPWSTPNLPGQFKILPIHPLDHLKFNLEQGTIVPQFDFVKAFDCFGSNKDYLILFVHEVLILNLDTLFFLSLGTPSIVNFIDRLVETIIDLMLWYPVSSKIGIDIQ